MSMTVMCVALGFGLDFSRASAYKVDQAARSQDAVEASIQDADTSGSLYWYDAKYSGWNPQYGTVPRPVLTVVDNYEKRSRIENVGVFRCEGTSPWYEIRIEERRGSNQSPSKWVAKGDLYMVKNPNDQSPDPAKVLDPTKFTFEGPALDPDKKYRVLNLTVHDSIKNDFLGMINMPCIPVTTDVSATVFGSQEDL